VTLAKGLIISAISSSFMALFFPGTTPENAGNMGAGNQVRWKMFCHRRDMETLG
jgi:hypothetical protein